MCLNLLQCFPFSLWDEEDGEENIKGTEAREHPERPSTAYKILKIIKEMIN